MLSLVLFGGPFPPYQRAVVVRVGRHGCWGEEVCGGGGGGSGFGVGGREERRWGKGRGGRGGDGEGWEGNGGRKDERLVEH
jgi:hypothetical protein